MFLSDNGGCAEVLKEEGTHATAPPLARDGAPCRRQPHRRHPRRRAHLPELRPSLGQSQQHALPALQAVGPRRRDLYALHRPLARRHPAGRHRHTTLPTSPTSSPRSSTSPAPRTPASADGGPCTRRRGEPAGPSSPERPGTARRTDLLGARGQPGGARRRLKLVAVKGGPWELYRMDRDRTETDDLADRLDRDVRRLSAEWHRWAARTGVVDWDELLVRALRPDTETASDRGPGVHIPGGTFVVGTDDRTASPATARARSARSRCARSGSRRRPSPTREFAAFVEATGHVTEAERFGWSLRLRRAARPTTARGDAAARRGRAVVARRSRAPTGAAPEGRGSGVDGARPTTRRPRLLERRLGVLRVGRDAACRRRPSGSTRPGAASSGSRYPWGDELDAGRRHRMQHLAGHVPRSRTPATTATSAPRPVDVVPAQRLRPLQHDRQRLGVVRGLVRARLAPSTPARRNPHGPPSGDATASCAAARTSATTSYCNRYRVAARSATRRTAPPATSASAGPATCRSAHECRRSSAPPTSC